MKDTFANRLAEALDMNGWRQVDLSDATGISKSRISQYLKGSYEAKDDALKKLAKALNVNEVWLMGYDVDSSPMKKVTEDGEVRTLAAHISDELGLTEEMAKKVIEIAKTLRDLK